MSVLILEDNQERIKVLKRLLFKEELFITDQVTEAIKLFEEHDPDILLLDHDLDQRVYVDVEEKNTGSEFARYLVGKTDCKQIILHSMNPAGVQYMKRCLPTAEIIPFPQLVTILSE